MSPEEPARVAASRAKWRGIGTAPSRPEKGFPTLSS